MDWYLVHMRWGQEQGAAARLAAHFACLVYCPEVLRRQRTDQWSELLFPGYVFVQARQEGLDPAAVDCTPGCGRIVRCGSLPGCPLGGPAQECLGAAAPVRLPNKLLKDLQGRLADVNAAGGLPVTSLQAPAAGGAVPERSLLDALDGLLAPSARVQVLLRSCCCALAARGPSAGELAAGGEPVKLMRRTRGRSRWIRHRFTGAC